MDGFFLRTNKVRPYGAQKYGCRGDPRGRPRAANRRPYENGTSG